MVDAPVFVLDASAVLALVHREPGWERVAPVVTGGLISAVNLTEVWSKLADNGIDASDIAAIIKELRLKCVPFAPPLVAVAGELRRTTRVAGLSLGDRACLATAIYHGAICLTAERSWPTVAPKGLVVERIR